MKRMILGMCLLILGCVTSQSGSILVVDRWVKDGILTKSTNAIAITIPPGLPNFTSHGDGVWMFEQDRLRVVGYPLKAGGMVDFRTTGGYFVVVWADGIELIPVSFEKVPAYFDTDSKRMYWVFENGQPKEVDRDDYMAIMKYWEQKETDLKGDGI